MALYDFSAQQVTPETTKEYVFDMIPGEPSLILAPAHDSNPLYLDERLRRSIEASERVTREAAAEKKTKRGAAQRLDPEELKRQIEEDREADRHLIAKACARAWGNPPMAADGSRPEFSVENCIAFFTALPDYMFDPLRNFAQNLYNFVARPIVTEEEAGRLGN